MFMLARKLQHFSMSNCTLLSEIISPHGKKSIFNLGKFASYGDCRGETWVGHVAVFAYHGLKLCVKKFLLNSKVGESSRKTDFA